MHNETFYLDGIDAALIGVRLQAPLVFSGAEPIVETVSIPGKNGTLVIDTGTYHNRKGEALCYALNDPVEETVTEITRFLLENTGYRMLETSDDPTHYWLARVSNGASIEQRARKLNPFKVIFDCKPQRFLKSGNTVIKLSAPTTIVNYTRFEAKPLIKINSSGKGEFYINDTKIKTVTNEAVEIFIDCENMVVYNYIDGEIQNASKYVYCDNFPVLKSGKNIVNWSEKIYDVEIKPRWWEL